VRFLADESCDAAITRALREAGYDVVSIAETSPGAADRVVLALALADDRVLVTRDKDFGELVFSTGARASGVLLVRSPPLARSALPQLVIELASTRANELLTSFVVITPSGVRVTRLPGR
jgi:predicted nuclease of predicted toxin-antitoxin system